MDEKPGNYNLLEEQWIPVLMNDGRFCRVGIKDALAQAGRIRQIAASNPMDRVAVLRFLLALLYWCKENPPKEGSILSGDSFPADWFSKLDESKDCFNLLGDGKRFYQDREAKRDQAVTHLVQEIPAGNNFWHFRHSTDRTDGLCLLCCVMGLLRLPLFSVSGLSGPKEPNLMAGINGVPPVYIVPWGKSLKETLLANWTSWSNLGEPSWVNSNSLPDQDEEVPILAGLTLLPRRVWLHAPDEQLGVCIGCGLDRTALIRTIEFQTAGKQENDKWNDPFVIYIRGKGKPSVGHDGISLDGKTGAGNEKQRKSLRAEDLTKAGKFRMDRLRLDLLARILEKGISGSLLVVGFATDKAKKIDVWEQTMDIASTKSTQETAQRWQDEGKRLEKQIEKIVRSEALGKAVIASIRPHVEARVSAKAGELLAGGDDAWESAAKEYRPMMRAIASSLSPGFTTAAVRRRRGIARLTPDMRPKAEADRKPGRKKGVDT